MLCEHANLILIDYAEGTLDDPTRVQVEQHLESCATCQADFSAIHEWRTMAANWHDEVPPAFQPPVIEGQGIDFWDGLRQWFPTFASAAALVLVTVMWVQQPAPNGQLPSNGTASYETLPELPQAQKAAVVDSVLESSREQRQEELNALLEYLTAEMNRRSIETEESMRFIISSQIQGQQELDELYQRLEALLAESESPAQGQADTNDDTPGVLQ